MAASLPPSEPLSTPPAWALARVPGLEGGAAPLNVRRLAGGSVNQVFRIDSRAGSFVLRLNGAAWRRPGVDRQRELLLHRAAAAGGIAPQIIQADPARDGLLITSFEPGRLWRESDYREVSALHRLGERLAALHALSVPAGVAAFDPWSIAQQYLALISASGHPAPSAEAQAHCERRCREFRSSAMTPCIVHGDLAHHNLLDGERLWLLDWEYAQCSDALMDVACVLAYYPQARPLAIELAAAAGIEPGFTREALELRVYVYEALTWLWHLARGESAPAH